MFNLNRILFAFASLIPALIAPSAKDFTDRLVATMRRAESIETLAYHARLTITLDGLAEPEMVSHANVAIARLRRESATGFWGSITRDSQAVYSIDTNSLIAVNLAQRRGYQVSDPALARDFLHGNVMFFFLQHPNLFPISNLVGDDQADPWSSKHDTMIDAKACYMWERTVIHGDTVRRYVLAASKDDDITRLWRHSIQTADFQQSVEILLLNVQINIDILPMVSQAMPAGIELMDFASAYPQPARDTIQMASMPGLTDVEERVWALEGQGDTVNVLEFWFRRCPWCIPSLRSLDKTRLATTGLPVRYFAINVVDEDAPRATAFLRSKGFGFVNVPRGRNVADYFGLTAYPTVIIVKSGSVVGKVAAPTPQEIESIVRRELQ